MGITMALDGLAKPRAQVPSVTLPPGFKDDLGAFLTAYEEYLSGERDYKDIPVIGEAVQQTRQVSRGKR